jgi:hypothetical protein
MCVPGNVNVCLIAIGVVGGSTQIPLGRVAVVAFVFQEIRNLGDFRCHCCCGLDWGGTEPGDCVVRGVDEFGRKTDNQLKVCGPNPRYEGSRPERISDRCREDDSLGLERNLSFISSAFSSSAIT